MSFKIGDNQFFTVKDNGSGELIVTPKNGMHPLRISWDPQLGMFVTCVSGHLVITTIRDVPAVRIPR